MRGEVGPAMIAIFGGTYVSDSSFDVRLAVTNATPTPHQGRATSAVAGAFGSGWRLRGKRATTEFDSVSGALPA